MNQRIVELTCKWNCEGIYGWSGPIFMLNHMTMAIRSGSCMWLAGRLSYNAPDGYIYLLQILSLLLPSPDAASVECSRVLHFTDFCILPEAAALTQLFGLSIVVERNLCGGRGQHAVPDWRLSARLRPTSPLRVGLHDYTLLRGILEHNIAAPPPTANGADTTSILVTSKWDGSVFNANEVGLINLVSN